jgi:hypothetical protein
MEGGDRQPPDETVIRSSPTVHHNSFIMALKAADEDSHNASVDITGAYLLVDMTNDVCMTTPQVLVDALISLNPSYGEFLQLKGDIVVKLDKALYGCVESALLVQRGLFTPHIPSVPPIRS